MAQLQQNVIAAVPDADEEKAGTTNPSFSLFNKVGTKLLVELTGQLALMLRTGSTLIDSLTALRDQTEHEGLFDILEAVESDISGGSSLAHALSQHPKVFDQFFVSTVEAGESSGQLVEVFQRLEIHLRKKSELKGQIVSALIYPCVIASVASSAVTFIIAFVLPRFTRIFEKAGVELPLPTRMLLAMSGFVTDYKYALIAGGVFAVVAGYFILKNPRTKRIVDIVSIHIPAVGPLVIMLQSALLLRTLGTMLNAGVSLVDSLGVTRRSCGNSKFKELIDEVQRRVTQGEPLRAAFDESKFISPSIKTMIATGEKSGSLPEVMTSVADFLDVDAERRLKQLSSALEPMIIVVMGVVVGFICVSILLPLFKLSAVAGGSG